MKHTLKYGMDSGLRNIRGYVAAFLKANIRTTFTYPKTIWYSLRYNAGEKFILHSNILYPFKYDLNNTPSQDREPVRVSTSLLTSLLDFQLQPYKSNKINENSLKALVTNFQTNLRELYKLFQYNRENENFDVPAAVPARVLYSIAHSNNINIISGKNTSEDFNKETLNFIVSCFIKKIEFADSDSISQILYAMHKLNLDENAGDWNKIIKALSEKSFDVEYTHVTPYFPLLFRYKEVEEISRKDMFISELGNKLFVLGYKSVFEAFYAIKSASEKNNKIEGEGILKNLEEKFANVKEDYSEYVKDL